MGDISDQTEVVRSDLLGYEMSTYRQRWKEFHVNKDSTVRYRILHFLAPQGQDVLLVWDMQMGEKQHRCFLGMPGPIGGEDFWNEALPCSENYATFTPVRVEIHHGERFKDKRGRLRERNTKTSFFFRRMNDYTTGAYVEYTVNFGKVSVGYHRQKGVNVDEELLEMSYDKARNLCESTLAKPPQAGYTTRVTHGPTYGPDSNTQGEIQMNTSEMITIMQLESGAKIVKAEYLNGAPSMAPAGYSFKNVIGLDLKEGDLIAVETRDTFEVVRVLDPDVMATEVGCNLSDLKHVVAKMKSDEFQAVKEAENNAVRRLALSEVTSKLDTYRQQVGGGAFDAVAGILGVDPSRNALNKGQDTIDLVGGVGGDGNDVVEPPAAPAGMESGYGG